MKIAIVIPTYRKLDGSTYNELSRALISIKEQTHQECKLFLIGDDYNNNDELMELSKIVPENKIYVENLPVAVERTKYQGYDLWVCGGNNATNTGIQRALDEGYSYICLLGHDDYYFPNHLEVISEVIEKTGAHFISTKCDTLPNINTNTFYTPYRPIPERVYVMSICIDFSYYKLRLVNTIEEYGYAYPSDADLWKRINDIMTKREEWGIFVNILTCTHPTEGYTKNSINVINPK